MRRAIHSLWVLVASQVYNSSWVSLEFEEAVLKSKCTSILSFGLSECVYSIYKIDVKVTEKNPGAEVHKRGGIQI